MDKGPLQPRGHPSEPPRKPFESPWNRARSRVLSNRQLHWKTTNPLLLMFELSVRTLAALTSPSDAVQRVVDVGPEVRRRLCPLFVPLVLLIVLHIREHLEAQASRKSCLTFGASSAIVDCFSAT